MVVVVVAVVVVIVIWSMVVASVAVQMAVHQRIHQILLMSLRRGLVNVDLVRESLELLVLIVVVVVVVIVVTRVVVGRRCDGRVVGVGVVGSVGRRVMWVVRSVLLDVVWMQGTADVLAMLGLDGASAAAETHA